MGGSFVIFTSFWRIEIGKMLGGGGVTRQLQSEVGV